jgi:DNA-binding NarL/FixJ family response regulator
LACVSAVRPVPGWTSATYAGREGHKVSSMGAEPIRVAVVNDYEIVVAGVAAMLAQHPERVRVVELDSGVPVMSDVDVILYDTFGQVQGDGVDLEELVNGSDAKVVIFSWNSQRELVDRAVAHGARGYLSKEMTGADIVAAIERVHAGEVVTPESDRPVEGETGQWPGRDLGLTAREAEVVALITQGLSNQEIAERSYLSINSVKTYIRTAYRKIGVTRRAQAVAWGMRNGFEPDRLRVIDAGSRKR